MNLDLDEAREIRWKTDCSRAVTAEEFRDRGTSSQQFPMVVEQRAETICHLDTLRLQRVQTCSDYRMCFSCFSSDGSSAACKKSHDRTMSRQLHKAIKNLLKHAETTNGTTLDNFRATQCAEFTRRLRSISYGVARRAAHEQLLFVVVASPAPKWIMPQNRFVMICMDLNMGHQWDEFGG